MTTADRPALIRCTLFLSSLAWILPLCVLGLCLLLVHDLNGMDPFTSKAAHSGSATISMGLSSIIQGHTLTAFACALVVFAVFAVGSVLATASLYTGRQALRLGAHSAPLILSVLAAGLYLAGILGLVIGSTMT
ncbi:MAG: hypothetical protein VX527_06675 [Planctomycetota bacterium]|nr:hypothetical protein [Planctomycetota bacterium]